MSFNDLNHLRKTEIEETLLHMMQDFSYEQITVKSLTDRLTIARKTFYHYFPSKQACLESMIDRVILECNLQLMSLPKANDPAQLYRSQFQFWIQHRSFLNAIIRNGLQSLMVERVLLCIQREGDLFPDRLSTKTMTCDEDILFYYVSGHISMLLKWCSDGFTCPVEEMVQKSLRLVYEPLLTREV